jgi:hypothetical protein
MIPDKREHTLQLDRHTFLMRLWREEDNDWRVMLQHTATRACFGFQDIAAAFAFVETFCYAGEKDE